MRVSALRQEREREQSKRSYSQVRCSVFSLLAEVFVLRQLASSTGGEFGVALGPSHLDRMLAQLLPPRPLQTPASGAPPQAHLIKVGFPSRRAKTASEQLCFSANLSRAEARAQKKKKEKRKGGALLVKTSEQWCGRCSPHRDCRVPKGGRFLR